MATLTDDQLRALQLLARYPDEILPAERTQPSKRRTFGTSLSNTTNTLRLRLSLE
jgi:hypothetical protein